MRNKLIICIDTMKGRKRMKEYKIKLMTQEEQITFSKICANFPFDINLYKGSYVVDAKSLLGVCSMDTTNGCIIKINASEGQIEKFEEKIKVFLDE